jgi:FtsP/CotA-like multicopper oxidase with cupredoxin domain
MSLSNRPAGQQTSSPRQAPDSEPAAGLVAGTGLSRRRFLRAGTGAAAALALGGPAAMAQGHAHGSAPVTPARPAQNLRSTKQQVYFESFGEPPVQSSRDGVLEATLRVVEVPISIPEEDGVRVEMTRTYNGMVPGPTFKVRAGDRLNVHLINELPRNNDANCPPEEHHVPHCFNTTNLHYHGLHVSPLPPSDAVFLEVPPLAEDPINGKFDYCVILPDFHKPGTHWYHAHKHGSTAIQLINGMAGALIIEDPPDQPVTSDEVKDRIFVLQEILGPSAPAVYNCADPPPVSFTVNGRYRPTLTARPGEVQRWRFINATGTMRGITPLRLTGPGGDVSMRLIAVDGIYLPAPRDVTTWTVAPGGRADVLVKFPSVGTYVLLKDPAPMPQPPPVQPLAVVEVAGPLLDLPLPGRLPPLPRYLRPPTEADRSTALAAPDRSLTFDVGSSPPCPGRFTVDGRPFDPHDPPLQVPFGATELWEVAITGVGGLHPFHIHINPFIVVHNGGQDIPEEERFWQDTVLVNGTVRFLTRYQNFHGKFVLHCHILNHEDWGMMRAVEVVGEGYGPCAEVSTELPPLAPAS